MLGRKQAADGKVWSVIGFTILGLVLDILFKRSGRSKFLTDVDRKVPSVRVHRVIQWGGDVYRRCTTKTMSVTGDVQGMGWDLLISIRSCLLSLHWVLKKSDQDVKEAAPGYGAVDGIMENAAWGYRPLRSQGATSRC